MKTSEFIKFFEDEGFKVHKGNVITSVEDENGNDILHISETNSVATDYIAFDKLPFEKQQEYYKVIFEYLMTPPEEREEKKKYYLKLKHFNSLHNYLNLNINSGEYELSTIESTQQFKTKFTEKEIDDIPEGIKSHNWEYVEVI